MDLRRRSAVAISASVLAAGALAGAPAAGAATSTTPAARSATPPAALLTPDALGLVTKRGAAGKRPLLERRAPPRITRQPASKSVLPGTRTSLTAAAAGKPKPEVHWQVSKDGGSHWKNIAGAVSSRYSFTAAATKSHHATVEYRAVFRNAAGSTRTRAASVRVASTLAGNGASSPPVIAAQPASQTVVAGSTATFTARYSAASPPSVQWQLSSDAGGIWQNVPGASSTTYSFPANTSQSGYEFRAVFKNAAGSTISNAATLTVTPAPAAPVITTQPAAQSVTPGETVTFTAAASGDPAPTAQWQVSANAGASWSPTTNSFVANASENGYEYRAMFTNPDGSTPTAAATLTVLPESTGNWSGYAASGASFTAINGTWVVPTAACGLTANSYSAQWAGIDGLADATVEQDGTYANCESAQPTYYAWYEMFGDQAVNGGDAVLLSPSTYPVSANDTITASVSVSGTNWVLRLADTTKGWSFYEAVSSPSPAPAESSAEWIVEDPTVCSTQCSQPALTNFGAVRFSGATAVRNGQSGSIAAFAPVAIQMTSGASVLATPGTLDSTGENFTVTWDAASG